MQQPANRWRCGARQAVPGGFERQHIRHRLRDVFALKGACARQHFVQHAAKSPDVTALICGLSPRLLRRHVRCGAENHAHLRHRPARNRWRAGHVPTPHRYGIQCFCKPKVQHLDGPVAADLNVRWFEIAVDDPLLMRGLQRLRNLAGDRQGITDRDRSTSDLLCEVLTFNKFHDQRTHGTGFFEAVDMRDVRVVQGGENLRFPLESSEPLGIAGKGLGECLDSDIAFKARVASLVDLTHAARADHGDNFVRADSGARGETHL